MMPVCGPTIGLSVRAALSVSHSLTLNSTMSTGPMLAGSSVALTLGRWIGVCALSMLSPLSRMAARCAPRAMNITSAPPCCSRAPK